MKPEVPTRLAPHSSLKQLAQHLGLSQTTVSRVVNRSPGHQRIAPATRQRVLAAAQELNYTPNILARGLRSKRSQIVSVIVPEISDGYSTSVLSGIEDSLLLGGYFYFVVSHRHRADLLRDYPSLLLARAVEGIIAVDTQIHADLPVPVVSVSGHRRHGRMVIIELDHVLAAQFALEHLKKLGHTNIAFIKGQSFSSDTAARWRAIIRVAAQLGIKVNPKLTVQLEETGMGTEPGRVATNKLLERGESFSAVFAFNDQSAIGAVAALSAVGLRVPEDVSIIGFDDIPSAATHYPALTTVRQPLQEMGRVAAATLLQMLREPAEYAGRTIRVLPTFVERGSTASARASRSAHEPVLIRARER